MKTIVGLYDDITDARQVVQELTDVGIDRERISLVAGDSAGRYSAGLRDDDDVGDNVAGGAVTGAVVGGLGGLLLGLGALAIPGIGPVIAAGPIVSALVGAGVGAALGGLVGALIEAGVPERQAGYYAEGVRRGGTLVTIEAPEHRLDEVVSVMEHHHPVNIDERATTWQQSGWTGFDASNGAASTTFDRERTRYASNGGNGYTTDTNGSTSEFSVYDPFFRSHYQTHFANSGYTYTQYEPAYRYGHTLATDDRYFNRNWDVIEPEARRYWGEHYQDSPWENFKEAVRYGWQQVKHAVAG